tara:strand:- start:2933 stop:3439 length:507 start_codon:yes stop_codon:yes gene_type:complete
MKKKYFLFFSLIIFACGNNNQLNYVSYTNNDSILMQKLNLCYNGDSVIYNGLKDEFFMPLERCRDWNYHSYEIDKRFYLVIPESAGYTGSAGGSINLYEKSKESYQLIDERIGFFNVQKSDIDNCKFYYTKVDKTTIPYKEYEYIFDVNYKKKEIRELEKNLINVWNN